MDEIKLAWLGLAVHPGLRPNQRARLLEAAGDPLALFRADRARIEGFDGISPELLDRIDGYDWRCAAEREARIAKGKDIHIVTPEGNLYPVRLLSTPDPPASLWMKGTLLPSDDLAVAVVGSRNPTPYGLEKARELGRDLAAAGITVVSGMALGIDGAAHRGALEAGGRTIAVLGSGLDVCYPHRHRRLFTEIAERGAVLSEYPLGSPPEPWRFPERNRLIAGLALGTVVVEAGEKSGALRTARLALDLGREVWAVPGRTTSQASVGTNALLRDGAAGLARDAADVIADLPFPWSAEVRREPGRAIEAEAIPGLRPEEAGVLARIGADEPVHVDALARETRLPVGALLDALVALEVRRLIVACPGGRYLRAAPPKGAAATGPTS